MLRSPRTPRMLLILASFLIFGCDDDGPGTTTSDTTLSSDATTTQDATGSDTGDDACGFTDAVDDSCTQDTDCALVFHQLDCCGSRAAVGVSTSAEGGFDTSEAACRETYPDCRCAQLPTTADDGNSGPEDAINVRCVSGTCETAFDTVALYCSPIPDTYNRSCTADTDCFAAVHQINCCGSFIATGLAASEKDRFDTAEAQCQQAYPLCGCPSMPTEADDGSTAPNFDSAPSVTCEAGVCTTSFTN